MGGGAWPFLVGGAISLVNSVNERDLSLLTSYVEASLHGRLLRGTMAEFLVSASHQLALTTSLPFVHTAHRSYRLNDPVKCSDRGDVGGLPSATSRKVNLWKDHCRTLETERPENDETSLSVGRFLPVPADSVVMRSSMPKTSVLVGSYASLPDITKPQHEKCQGKCN
ncbi:hypothetical protein YC2023_066040 [Brassica napus]